MDFNIASYVDIAKAGDVFTVFNLSGGASETSDFSSVEIGNSSLSDSNGTWSGTYLGGAYQFNKSTGELTVVTAPEPSTYALFGMGLGVLSLAIVYRRRRV